MRTEPGGSAWRQTIFHRFALMRRHGRGVVLRPVITAPSYESRVRRGSPSWTPWRCATTTGSRSSRSTATSRSRTPGRTRPGWCHARAKAGRSAAVNW
ncbi:alpha-L-arabinofuranosidase C-terminal domain-containing protein [Amycolatopsis australiensis]|uniref:alpha-L-arabinofuranosidase C-terminal domain-containing protein n=1 Tax=Amycolatopsis australiensis TaxID=546364 RepID=UPI003CCC3FE2